MYTFYITCRFCKRNTLEKVLYLGTMPLAGGFLQSEKDFIHEKFYPLQLCFCTNCFLLQTNIVIDSDILFKNYFYFSSKIKTLVEHFQKTAKELQQFMHKDKNNFLVEIGCNDGSFLTACIQQGWNVLGIDPAKNIVKPLIQKGFPVLNNYFTKKVSDAIIKQYGKADIIFSSNTMAHIENMGDVLKGIKNLLKIDGIFIFEVHYLGNLVEDLQYDMMYHEHQYYYSVHTLQKFLKGYDMEIFDVQAIPIHAGSIRVYAQNKNGKRKREKRVFYFLQKEMTQGLTRLATFKNFKNNIEKTKKDLLTLLYTLKKQNKRIAGYGASGRGTVIMSYCGLDEKILDYIIDDAPAKQGAFTPGNHLKIIASDILQTKKRPDYVLIFAWSFLDEIKKRNKDFLKNGGKFIVPLPKVRVI